jgi:glycosyltransferase involved in cell wall biosynthesis
VTVAVPRLLVLTPEYAPYAWGGLATYLHEVVARLVATGVGVDVVVAPTYAVATDRVDRAGLVDALVVDSDAEPREHLAAIGRAWGRDYYDALYVQDPAAAPLAALALERGVCGRVIAAAHLPTYSGFSYFDKPEDDLEHQALEAFLFRLSHTVIAPSSFAADVLLRVHRLAPDDIAVIPYGAPSVEPVEREHGAGCPLHVLSVGRVAKQKGLLDLCDIAAAVPHHVASFSHIGSARSGDDDGVLSDAPIRQHGYLARSDVLRELQTADIVVSTSMYETFGLALLEGMAAGAVPVAYECEALHEFIEPERSGVMVRQGHVAGVVETLYALHHDRERLASLRRGAVAAARRLSWHAHTSELASVLFN